MLSEIVDLLSGFGESNPGEFTELLDNLQREIEGLKEETRQKQLRPKTNRTPRFSRGAADSRHQGASNAVTRSRSLVLQNKPALTLRATLKSEDIPGTSKPWAVSASNSSINSRPSVSRSVSEATAVARKDMTVGGSIDSAIGVKLKQRIQGCRDTFRGQSFIVTCDGHSETVNPVEIEDFFSRFQEGAWLSSFNLMPLIFSFDWPSTTLLLHSSYTSFPEIKNGNSKRIQTQRWPLDDNHDRVILPCCFRNHWTLFDVDLKNNSIRQYNSLVGDISELTGVISMIEERLAPVMEGRENTKFTVEIGVRSFVHCLCF